MAHIVRSLLLNRQDPSSATSTAKQETVAAQVFPKIIPMPDIIPGPFDFTHSEKSTMGIAIFFFIVVLLFFLGLIGVDLRRRQIQPWNRWRWWPDNRHSTNTNPKTTANGSSDETVMMVEEEQQQQQQDAPSAAEKGKAPVLPMCGPLGTEVFPQMSEEKTALELQKLERAKTRC
jgi:hypothetical protein